MTKNQISKNEGIMINRRACCQEKNTTKFTYRVRASKEKPQISQIPQIGFSSCALWFLCCILIAVSIVLFTPARAIKSVVSSQKSVVRSLDSRLRGNDNKPSKAQSMPLCDVETMLPCGGMVLGGAKNCRLAIVDCKINTDFSAKNCRLAIVDCNNTTHFLSFLVSATDSNLNTCCFYAPACVTPYTQAETKISGQNPAASLQHKPQPAQGERLAAGLTKLKDNPLAKEGRKEVFPAACGGNARGSGRRLAANAECRIKNVELKSEYQTIIAAAKRNGLNADQTAILLAIRKAENGRAGREFGVLHPKAVDTNIHTQAGWAAATIKKNAERFSKEVRSQKSEVRSKEFIHFLADRYCPPSVDPVGNRNWKKNVWAIVNCKF
jgi:hypothetical protein